MHKAVGFGRKNGDIGILLKAKKQMVLESATQWVKEFQYTMSMPQN